MRYHSTMTLRWLVLLASLLVAACSSSPGGETSGSGDGSSGGAACPEGGATPVEGPDGLYVDCEVLFEGCCFRESRFACEAAGCGSSCTILETEPGQIDPCQ
jgi:hypothetical protein